MRMPLGETGAPLFAELQAASRAGRTGSSSWGASPPRSAKNAPAPPWGELLLDPVKASEPTAEVVDHVHERSLARARHHRAAVLQRAVMGEDDVPDRLSQLGGEPLDVLDRAPYAVVAERDLAVQAPGVREVDVARIVRIGLELADVVQQCAGHRHVAIDPREGGA